MRIRNISLRVLGPAADDQSFTDLIQNSGLVADEVLHHGRFEALRNSLLTLGQQRGYLDGKVVLSRVEVQADAGRADVVWAGGKISVSRAASSVAVA